MSHNVHASLPHPFIMLDDLFDLIEKKTFQLINLVAIKCLLLSAFLQKNFQVNIALISTAPPYSTEVLP